MPARSILRVLIFSLFIGAGSVTSLFAAETLRLDLRGTLALALRQNLTLRVDEFNGDMAAAALRGATGRYDPWFSASLSSGKTAYPGETFGSRSNDGSVDLSQEIPGGGSLYLTARSGYTSADVLTPGEPSRYWQSSLGLTLAQPLLKDAGLEASDQSILLARDRLQSTRDAHRYQMIETAYRTVRAYHRLAVLQQKLEIRKEVLAKAEAMLGRLEGWRQGKKRRMGEANIRFAEGQRRQRLIDTGRALRDQEADLRYLLALPRELSLVLTEGPTRQEPPETEAQALAEAMANRADLKQLELSLTSNRLLERVSKRNLLPDLSASLSAGLADSGPGLGESWGDVTAGKGGWWEVGLDFSIPLGNRQAESDYRQNHFRSRQLELQIADLKWQIRDQIQADLRGLIADRLQMRTADQSFDYARQRLKAYQDLPLKAAETIKNSLSAEDDLVEAQLARIDAVESFANDVALLWRDAGVLLMRRQPDPAGVSRLDSESEDISHVRRQERRQSATAHRAKGPLSPSVAKERPGMVEGEPLLVSPPLNSAQLDHWVRFFAGRNLHLTTTEEMMERPMLRLLFAEVATYPEAKVLMTRLRQAGGDSFTLPRRGRLMVYAGSYRRRDYALEEQQRLATLGLAVEIQPVVLALKQRRLHLTGFADSVEAGNWQKRLAGEQNGWTLVNSEPLETIAAAQP